MNTLSEIERRAQADLVAAKQREVRAREALESAAADRVRLENFLAVLAQYEAGDNVAGQRTARGGRTSSRGDAAIAVITRLRRPLEIHALGDAVEEMGVQIGGGERRNAYLASYLSKDPRLKYHRGRGWWPVELGELPASDADLLPTNSDPPADSSPGGSREAGARDAGTASLVDLPTYRMGGGGT